MKDIEKFYNKLNDEMESEAGKTEMIFRFPEEEKRKTRLPYLAVAAALLLIVPISTKISFSQYQLRKLLNEENGHFIDSMFNEKLFSDEYLTESLLDSDWFDSSESLFN